MITAISFSGEKDGANEGEVTFFTSSCDSADYEDDTTSVEDGKDGSDYDGSSLTLPYARKDMVDAMRAAFFPSRNRRDALLFRMINCTGQPRLLSRSFETLPR